MIAVLFILVVLLFPQGMIGMFARLERRFGGRQPAGAAIVAPVRIQSQAPVQLAIEQISAQVGEVKIQAFRGDVRAQENP